MKNLMFVAAAVAALFVAACGGGSGGGVMPPGPTATPAPTPLAYAAKIVWSGTMHYATAGLGDMRPASIDSSSGAILMVAGDSTSPTALGGDPRGATVAAQVSPAPTAYPTTTFTTTISAIATIAPTPTPGPSASPQPPTILLEPGQDNASGSGTVTATIAAPVASATTAPAIVYPMLALECLNPDPSEPGKGVQLVGSAWVSDPDPTTADLYLTDPNGDCFPATATANTINYPGGGTWLDATNAFDLVATTDWANSGTSAAFGALDQTLVFKTRGGVFAKFHLLGERGASVGIAGAIEYHGQGLDSF